MAPIFCVLLLLFSGCQPAPPGEPIKSGEPGATAPLPVRRKTKQLQINLLNEYLLLVQDRKITLDDLEAALVAIACIPATEKPEFWTRIVNDPTYTEDHRRDCLVTFFRRHIRPGMRLNSIHSIPGTETWFSPSNLHKVTIAEVLPIENRGECVYDYSPDLLRSSRSGRYIPQGHGAVVFSLTRYIPDEGIAQVLSGQKDDGGARIIEIASSPGDTREDLGGPRPLGQPKPPFSDFRKFQ